MLDFNKKPFNWLPLNQGDLFDLTCEYTISILDRLNQQYHSIQVKAEHLSQRMPV